MFLTLLHLQVVRSQIKKISYLCKKTIIYTSAGFYLFISAIQAKTVTIQPIINEIGKKIVKNISHLSGGAV